MRNQNEKFPQKGPLPLKITPPRSPPQGTNHRQNSEDEDFRKLAQERLLAINHREEEVKKNEAAPPPSVWQTYDSDDDPSPEELAQTLNSNVWGGLTELLTVKLLDPTNAANEHEHQEEVEEEEEEEANDKEEGTQGGIDEKKARHLHQSRMHLHQQSTVSLVSIDETVHPNQGAELMKSHHPVPLGGYRLEVLAAAAGKEAMAAREGAQTWYFFGPLTDVEKKRWLPDTGLEAYDDWLIIDTADVKMALEAMSKRRTGATLDHFFQILVTKAPAGHSWGGPWINSRRRHRKIFKPDTNPSL